MPQKKRRASPSKRKTQNSSAGRRAQRHSPPRYDPGGITTPGNLSIARHPCLIPRKGLGEPTFREQPRRANSQLPHVDLTKLPKISSRRPKPLTPPPTSTNGSHRSLLGEAITFPVPRARVQDDDAASQGSMTTWMGDRDGAALPSSREREDMSFDFDWADERADKPPVPWDQIQSYTDFHDNKKAHEYWQWDQKELKWSHVDAETGEIVFCSLELD